VRSPNSVRTTGKVVVGSASLISRWDNAQTDCVCCAHLHRNKYRKAKPQCAIAASDKHGQLFLSVTTLYTHKDPVIQM